MGFGGFQEEQLRVALNEFAKVWQKTKAIG